MIYKLINSLNEKQINELKKHFGKEDFKNDLLEKIKSTVDFNIEKNKDIPQHTGKTFFEIVKSRKKFSPDNKFFLLDWIKSSLITYPLISEFKWVEVEVPVTPKFSDHIGVTKSVKGIRAITKNLNTPISNYSGELEEGDTINIKISDFQENLFSEDDILDNILKPTVIFLFGDLNFNFTFLIELDPL